MLIVLIGTHTGFDRLGIASFMAFLVERRVDSSHVLPRVLATDVLEHLHTLPIDFMSHGWLKNSLEL